jgi:sugar lactone lactonase YvrE
MDQGYIITNGPAFSPDGTTLYHNDTGQRRIYSFECDPETGTLGDRHIFAEIPEELGYPDGLTVDADGGLWCALWGGWRVTRFTPDGEIDRDLKLPASQVTSCTFGGENLDTLFVTTASIGLTSEQRAAQPEAGGLFALDPGVRGLPTPAFAPRAVPDEEKT